MKRNLLAIMLVLVCIAASFLLGRCTGESVAPPAEPVVIHDTISLTDSTDIAAHTKPKYVTRTDTLWLPRPETPCDSTDSVCDGRVTDSIPVEIPIMAYEYRDTFATDSSRIELGVQFSGYKAKIDSIELQYEFSVQPRTIVKKRGWGQFVGVGIGAGYGVSVVGNTPHAAPQIGITIVYGFGYHW